MIRILFFAVLLLGCSQPKNTASCPADSLTGRGMGESRQEALTMARVDISSQIHLSITAANEYSLSQLWQNNKENLEKIFNSQVNQTTELLNAQDAKLQSVKKEGNNVKVLACMSREDAAKPYIDKLPQINDSLNFAVQKMLAQTHPLAKKEAALTAANLKMRQIITSQILRGLGRPAELPNDEPYKAMIKNYENNFSAFKFIWEDDGNPVSQVLLANISSRYKIETGTCVQGLKLIPVLVREIQCEQSQFGPQCSYWPALEGRSCDNELYFTLRGQMVRATGERNENDAMRKLYAIIPAAPFWNEWLAELDKYK